MYCVYFTVYKGNKLPKRYIGSSTVNNVLKGYNGSIKSKKYKEIYLEEQKNSKSLFKTRILKTFKTKEEAQQAELYLHKKYNVVKSCKYMNMALAQPNGYFGSNISGKSHPFYGKTRSEKTKKKISESISKCHLNGTAGRGFLDIDKKGKNNPFYGKRHSEESKNKMRKPKRYVPKFECPHCKKMYDSGNLKQHMIRNGYNVNDWLVITS